MDKYDKAVKYLEDHPEEIHEAWNAHAEYDACDDDSGGIRPGVLFLFATPDGCHKAGCGCLSQIRIGRRQAWVPELTRLIAADERLPACNPDGDYRECIEALPVFAEWQRRIDKWLDRDPDLGYLDDEDDD